MLGVSGLARLSLRGGNPGLGGAACLFFRSSIAFISLAFSGVIEGVLGARIGGGIGGVETIELEVGLPPLVWGRTGPGETGESRESGIGGGDNVMDGVSGVYVD